MRDEAPPDRAIRTAGITTAEEAAERVCYCGGRADASGACVRCGFRKPQPSRQAKAVKAGEGVTELGGI